MSGDLDFDAALGVTVRRVRRNKYPDMTQDELASYVQADGHSTFSRAALSEVERGNRSLKVSELVSLTSCLGVTVQSTIEVALALKTKEIS